MIDDEEGAFALRQNPTIGPAVGFKVMSLGKGHKKGGIKIENGGGEFGNVVIDEVRFPTRIKALVEGEL